MSTKTASKAKARSTESTTIVTARNGLIEWSLTTERLNGYYCYSSKWHP